jgi:cell division protein FtsN
MKTNSLLTYLLYALLATLILAAGYKACQMQKEKQQKAREQAEWDETIRKLYPENDSAGGGSSYVSRDSATPANAKTTPKNGIEDEPKTTAAKPTAPKTTTTTPGTSSAATTTQPKTTAKSPAVKGAGTGRYSVQAGAFANISGARERLEQIIKLGYTNAEIGRSGKYHVVVVMRTNDKAKAIQVNDQLERRGLDAMVVDKNRK